MATYTALTVTNAVRSGVEPTYASANASGNAFANNKHTVLEVVNASTTTACTVTILTPGTVDGQAVGNRDVAVTTSTRKVMGPWPTAIYNRSDDTVRVDYSDVSQITVAVIQV